MYRISCLVERARSWKDEPCCVGVKNTEFQNDVLKKISKMCDGYNNSSYHSSRNIPKMLLSFKDSRTPCSNAYYTHDSLPIEHAALLETPKKLRFQKLANRNILRETLPPPCLQHKVAGELLCGGGLERSGCEVLVERVTGYDGPAVENEGEGDLALCVDLW
jgi:hypothetical protein